MVEPVVFRNHDVSGMWVCPACATLRGPAVPVHGGPRLFQPCTCERTADHRVDWPGWDFSKVVELCGCCARVAIQSGSRWSVFFCTWCKALVTQLNREAGGCVVPIGRHSIMNGLALDRDALRSPSEITGFVRAFSSLIDRMTYLDDWTARRARRVLEHCADEVVDLPTYLATAPLVLSDPRAALDELLAGD